MTAHEVATVAAWVAAAAAIAYLVGNAWDHRRCHPWARRLENIGIIVACVACAVSVVAVAYQDPFGRQMLAWGGYLGLVVVVAVMVAALVVCWLFPIFQDLSELDEHRKLTRKGKR